jgi:hypothetical protein
MFSQVSTNKFNLKVYYLALQHFKEIMSSKRRKAASA